MENLPKKILSLPGRLFKLLTEGRYLLIEYKNESSESLSWAMADLQHAELIWQKKLTLPGNSLYSASYAGDKFFVLKNYDLKNYTLSKGMCVYDTKEARPLWSDQNFIFVSAFDEVIEVRDFHYQERILQVNAFTGEVLQGALLPSVVDLPVIYPQTYVEGNVYYEDIFRFLHQIDSNTVRQPIYYAESKLHITIAYQNLNGSIICVLNKNGEIAYTDMSQHIYCEAGREPFFISSQRLVYCNNYSDIAVVFLN
ncbi:MAG: hypothetical protein NZ529_06560 [Cytophagaceae bacterium]|nr:hypothetical protein [Cytophagaceae bacterium]MDW8456441.1 hypothetical protein [Cytophagaceae bacterium]